MKTTEEGLATLSRIMPNIGGHGIEKRELLNGVVQSILLYGTPVWLQVYLVYNECKKM